MPFSFIEIEESKNRIIALVFLFIILFYFLTAYLLLIVIENSFNLSISEENKTIFFLPPLNHVLAAFIVACVAGFLHWIFSTENLIEKSSLAVGAFPIDLKDTYHQYFKNIVDDVSVALGSRKIEAMVIPSIGMNAFSLEDFNKRAVIGITEGLLSRLNRAQIEAVVGHEAGHIAAGDSLNTTAICSLSEIYEESLSKIKAGIGKVRGQGLILFILLFLILSVMNLLSKLLRYFVSRQREYRADAIAVRLTRNPLALAEALKLISGHWRGEGSKGEKMESIFIINPRYSNIDEEEGLLSNIFSTHPPVRKRINILLAMAHLDEKTLLENLKNFIRASPVAQAVFKPKKTISEKKWFILDKEKWQGPFLLDELNKLGSLRPEQWVRIDGQDTVIPAYEDDALRAIFMQGKDQKEWPCCPHCKSALEQINYEGVPVLKCSYCEGMLVEQNKITRIFTREDLRFSEETKRLGQTIINSKDRHRLSKKPALIIDCPKCRHKMRRQFFVYSYPVEIDRCTYCTEIWFDKQELELLQYLYENKEKFFEGGSF